MLEPYRFAHDVGGLLGGPIARWPILKNNLAPDPVPEADLQAPQTTSDAPSEPTDAGELFTILKAILALTICVGLGDMVNVFLFERGVLLPGFLTAMFIGILIANISDRLNVQINSATVDKFGEVSLNIFLAMSLMSVQLWSITTAFTSIMVVLMAQTLMITLIVVFVVFRLIGRDYDASVISAGFVGLGMGATPVAIANMDAVTSKYGPSPKAFLIVPLIGAFFVDILNAVVVKFFIGQLVA